MATALHQQWQCGDSPNGSNFLGLGTHLKYYIEEGGAFNDITPIRSNHIADGTNIFYRHNDGSSVITVSRRKMVSKYK